MARRTLHAVAEPRSRGGRPGVAARCLHPSFENVTGRAKWRHRRPERGGKESNEVCHGTSDLDWDDWLWVGANPGVFARRGGKRRAVDDDARSPRFLADWLRAREQAHRQGSGVGGHRQRPRVPEGQVRGAHRRRLPGRERRIDAPGGHSGLRRLRRDRSAFFRASVLHRPQQQGGKEIVRALARGAEAHEQGRHR